MMRSLQPVPQCIDCLLSLAKTVAALADPADADLVAEAERIYRAALAQAADKESSSVQIANRILREIKQVTGIADPYENFKALEIDQARRVFSQLPLDARQDLQSLVKLAALGNSLDFFKNPLQALADIPHQFGKGITFYRDNLADLQARLENTPQRGLYLTDNAGEIYFDIPLYDYLKLHCRQIYLVVKGGPALNDLTRAELQSAGLAGRFEAVVDTGTDGVGIDWDHVSTDFLDLVASADLVVSKGMANFETLFPKRISAPVFFIFKVKCEPMQNYIQAPLDSFMALWKAGN